MSALRPTFSLVVVLALLAGAGCKGKPEEQAASAKPPPMSPIEIARAQDACKAYIDRLCSCARTRPELAERCQLKEAKRSAISMLLEVDKTDQASPAELFQIQDEIRKIVAKCIEEDNALDRESCPRLGAAAAAGSAGP